MNKYKISLLSFLLILLTTMFSACSGDGGDNSLLSGSQSLSSGEDSSANTEEDVDRNTEPSSSEAEEEGENTAVGPQIVRVDAEGGLRMRAGPGTEHEIIRVIPEHDYAELAEAEEAHRDWIYIKYDGEYGWVSTEFISFEQDIVTTSDSESTSWASIYHDYVSAYKAVTYTSNIYGGQYVIAGHVVNGTLRGCDQIEFWSITGYDYPVLISREIPIDADGGTDAFMFVQTAYLIVGNEVVEIDDAKWSTFFRVSTDGPGYDVNGTMIERFIFKPDNGGSPENIAKALAWLKSKAGGQ